MVSQTAGQNDSAFPGFDLQALPDKYLFGVTGTRTLTPKAIYSFG